MPQYRHNKDSLKQPQVTLVVPGGALGTQARRRAEEDTRGRFTGGLPLLLTCVQQQPPLSLWLKRCCGRCCNTSLKQDKWRVMWLALVRLFIVRFKGQVAVSNYAPRRDAAASAWVPVHWTPRRGKERASHIACHLWSQSTFSLGTSGTIMTPMMTNKLLLPGWWHYSPHKIIFQR